MEWSDEECIPLIFPFVRSFPFSVSIRLRICRLCGEFGVESDVVWCGVVCGITPQVNWPKKKNTLCTKCGKHTSHNVSQYKAGKASTLAQGRPPSSSCCCCCCCLLMRNGEMSLGKRRYDRKQSGFGGQTKPVFRKKVRPLLCGW